MGPRNYMVLWRSNRHWCLTVFEGGHSDAGQAPATRPQDKVPLHATSTVDRLFACIKRQAGGVDLGPVLQRP